MFALDPTTLYRARTEYQSEFKRHWKEDSTGESLRMQIMYFQKRSHPFYKKEEISTFSC